MTIYLHDPVFLVDQNTLTTAPRNEYLLGNIEDPFDSYQYQHLDAHNLFLHNTRALSHCDSAYFMCSPKLSQIDLAVALLSEHKDKLNCDALAYTHNSFSEDLSICSPSYVVNALHIKPTLVFSIIHHGGANMGLAIQEMALFLENKTSPSTGIVVGAERICSPYNRHFNPPIWLSDGAGGAFLSTERPQTGYVIEDVITYAAQNGDESDPLSDTCGMVDDFFSQNCFVGDIIYPAFTPKLRDHLNTIRVGRSWKNGDMGSLQGIELLASLKEKNPHKKKHLIFIEPSFQLICISLRAL